MKTEINKELVFLYWSGLATPMQRQLLEEWLGEPDHQELFYLWRVEWETKHPQSNPDLNRAWSQLVDRIEHPMFTHQPQQQSGFLRYAHVRTWWIAATFVLAVGASWIFRNQLFYQTYQTAYGQLLPVKLSDGSSIVLNANSQLRILRPWLSSFLTNERIVELRGEANFNVTHQADDQRFVVQTDHSLDVVVLGTEFMVTARPKQFRVGLHSGKVLLRPADRSKKTTLAMHPGDLFIQTADKPAKLQHRQPTRQLTSWQTHDFVFDHTPLPDVLAILEDQYGLQIAMGSDSMATIQITGRIRAQRASDLLSAITALTGYTLAEKAGVKQLIP